MVERIAIFPLHTILFPQTDLGLHVFEERYKTLVARCLETGEGFGVALIRKGSDTGPAEPHAIGTMARIAAYARLPGGRYLVEVEGTQRFRIHAMREGCPYPEADVSWLSEPIGNFADARGRGDAAENLLQAYRARNGDGDNSLKLPVDPVARSYVLASLLKIDMPEKQTLLESPSADERLALEVSILRREVAVLDHLKTRGG